MRFMMMVKNCGQAGQPPKEFVEAMAKISEEAAKSGAMVISGGLGPLATSTRVRLAGGELAVVDGPFTESKEYVGGFAIFDFATKEEAVKATVGFMDLHKKYWPGWEGETEIRQMFGPQDPPPRG
jgi:hypothetical protein